MIIFFFKFDEVNVCQKGSRKDNMYLIRPFRKLILKTSSFISLLFLLFCYIHFFTKEVQIPRVIWMFWDRGFEQAPELQRACLKSWSELNTNFKIVILDMKQAEAVINRKIYYTDDAWNSAIIQAKSDIIRLELLAQYGGIWADATVHCNEPLVSWIDSAAERTNFFTYERRDTEVTQNKMPHISSWFIATTNTSYLISRWRHEVRKRWSIKPYPPNVYGYYWVHRIFRDLTRTDPDFYYEYNKMHFINAAGPHCLTHIKSYMYKMTANPCITRFKISSQQFVK